MWTFVFFDLLVKTKVERRNYTRFRRLLLEEGFMQMQYSVYARYHVSEKKGEPVRQKIRRELPINGKIRILKVTDRQFSKMENYVGGKTVQTEEADEQFLLF